MSADPQQRWKRSLEYDRRSMLAAGNSGTSFPGPGAEGNSKNYSDDEEAQYNQEQEAEANEAQDTEQENLQSQQQEQTNYAEQKEAALKKKAAEKKKKEEDAAKAEKKKNLIINIALWFIPGGQIVQLFRMAKKGGLIAKIVFLVTIFFASLSMTVTVICYSAKQKIPTTTEAAKTRLACWLE